MYTEKTMLDLLDSFSRCTAAVIGDVMLDHYLMGEVKRISPEAPVPVMRVGAERTVPGGAANVACNLRSLGVQVLLVGLTGTDAARDTLVEALDNGDAIDCTGLIASPIRQTTRKLRIIGEHQQIVRVDHEDDSSLSDELEKLVIVAGRRAIAACDVVIISDYGKGVCGNRLLAELIGHARSLERPVLVDPKQRDLSVYAGATILTPNRKELTDATGLACETDDEAETAAAEAQRASGSAILLTRSDKGMSLFPIDGPPIHLATVAQDVFDVSGAGDTVVAVLAASLAAGIPPERGMHLANHAAGIVVSKVGTASVTRDELAYSLSADMVSADIDEGKLISLTDAQALRAAWARDKLVVGFTNGCFDLLHPGHVSLLRQAAGSCDRLIVALNTDASVRHLKGPSRPLQDEVARAEVMGAIRYVSTVILFDEDTPLAAIEALQPDILVKGADYREDEVVGADVVRARGGRVMLIDLSPGRSTTALVAAGARQAPEQPHP